MNNDLISRSALEAKAKTIYMEFDNVAVPTRVISIADLHLAPTVDAEPVWQWISVKDAQPEKGVNVLFHPICNPDSIYIGCINHVGEKGACYFEVRRGKYKTQYSATHWMPLPEPPKEDVYGKNNA